MRDIRFGFIANPDLDCLDDLTDGDQLLDYIDSIVVEAEYFSDASVTIMGLAGRIPVEPGTWFCERDDAIQYELNRLLKCINAVQNVVVEAINIK